jgi:hypothetical protein
MPPFLKPTCDQAAALGLALAGVALLVACSAPPTTSPPAAGSLSGRVRLEGVFTALSGITLRLRGPAGEFTVSADSRGYYAFQDIPAGRYSLTAERERYYPATLRTVTVAPGAETPPLTLRNHRELLPVSGIYDASRLEQAEDPEFGGMVLTRSPFLTNLALSPDGTRLGFIEGGAVKSVRLDGTDARTEKPLPAGMQADWLDWGQRGFLLRSWTGSASASITLLAAAEANGAEPQILVPGGNDENFAPVFSPDERQIAYVRYEASTRSPQLMRLGIDGGKPEQLIDLLERLNLRGIWDGKFGLMFSPVEWRPEGLMFHAPMTCHLERSGFTLGKDGIYVLRDPDAPAAAGGLHKAHFYSYYPHAFSHDGTRMLYAYGPQIRSKDLRDPVVSAPGLTVGHHSDERLESLTPAPDGDRLFYLTPSGIEEMTLLP